MSNMFSKKNSDKENIDEELKKNDVISKLNENSSITNKLDFNIEYLNAYLVKAINSFFKSRYLQNIDFAKKYLTDNCKNSLINDINIDKNTYKYSNLKINIKNIHILYQNMQSINYISDLILEVKVSLVYYRENIYTSIVRQVEEEYNQQIWFLLKDNGWLIEKYYNREYIYLDEDKIISI